jgi:hypothetical protein
MDGECFLFQSQKTATWKDAVRDCLNNNAHLLEIDSNNGKFVYPDAMFNLASQIGLGKPIWVRNIK